MNYREACGMFVSNGIPFNLESPIRGDIFVTRKLTSGVSRIEVKLERSLYLGNLDAKRDWGHANDYVESMHMILQADKADDFVLATGETRPVREMVELPWHRSGVASNGVAQAWTKSVSMHQRKDGGEDRWTYSAGLRSIC